MDVFERLRKAAVLAGVENDLPDFLAERIFAIADRPEHYRHLESEIADLADQLPLYDTYGQTGYLGMGLNDIVLGETLKRLEERGVRKDEDSGPSYSGAAMRSASVPTATAKEVDRFQRRIARKLS